MHPIIKQLRCKNTKYNQKYEIQLYFSTYNADDLLARFADFLCPAHVPDGQSCNLPLNPGTYGGDPPIEVEIPEIPDILAELVGAGTYYLGANVNLEDGSLMACLYVRVEVEA